MASAACSFAAALVGWLAGGGELDVPWAPTLGLRLDLAFDGLGALYALLATGIGLAVFAYGTAYLPWHLEHEERPAREARRFWAWMVLFMASMVGLACARDLVLLFVFFDLTAVASYFLIGFDRERREARGAALMALLVTGVSAVALLIGAVLLFGEYGTFSLPELFERAAGGTTTAVAGGLIAVAALVKSAQAPMHFWLPRAMEAPTPVSAYLHSAAMVAAGVLVLGRVHPLLALNDIVLDGLLVVGLVSIAVGGVLALAQDELKQILAHSTISQYGYVVVLYGLGGAAGSGAAALYVIAHAIAKSALFMTAGAVTVATGETRLSRLGGLARELPIVAVASGLAAATLAALPLTIGFFKDELFFAAAREAGWAVQVMAVLAAALTFAYIGRFWLGLFIGPRRAAAQALPALLVAPVAALAALAVAGGVVVEPFAELAGDAASITHGSTVAVDPAYHPDTRAENVMAVAAWMLGLFALAVGGVRNRAVAVVARVGDLAGPRRVYGIVLKGLNGVSDRIHDAEVRDLRVSLAAVMVPGGLFVALGFLATPTEGAYVVGSVGVSDLPIVAVLALAATAAVRLTRERGRLGSVLALSVVGFGLAAVYAIAGAPDVALVAVLVETVITLVFVGVFSRLPTTRPDKPSKRTTRRRRRNGAAAAVAGAAAFLHAETGLEASLAIPAYQATVCVVRCRGENASQPPLGEAPPAHCTATGKALLAHLAAWRRAVLAAPLSRCTERSTVTPQALEREFAWIRMHGYAIEDGEHIQGVRQLAAPIVGPEGDVLAAIAVAGYAANTPVDPRDELPGRIRNAAAAASDALAAGASEYPLNRGIPYRLLASYGLSPADARL